ncbi:hypothetical protein EI555_009232 [Monodon monoceros]|uniref:HTH psq-type domain-containing protein n=1 Tax=Monodon monoceros TaxID=40151 RepID=A0A4U1FC42_MONMO|nr:hypothetical protein EI555_009232 [Monodon monoceros]
METKVKVIERMEQGEKMVDVAHSYNMNRSTIGTILKNKDKLMEHVNSAVPMMLTIISKKCGKVMEEMEVVILSAQLKFQCPVTQKYVCFIFVLIFQQYMFALFILLMA